MSTALVQPYLFFFGRCEEALEFYRAAVDAQLGTVLYFKDGPEPPEGFEDKVMHTSFRIGQSTILASDGCIESNGYEGFSLSLTIASEEEAERIFSALANGGIVEMPLTETLWSPSYGIVTDQFGISWMINVLPENFS
jgi:PhnB protein